MARSSIGATRAPGVKGVTASTCARRSCARSTWRRRAGPGQLLTDPCCWAVLDYSTLDVPDVRGAVNTTVSRAGTAHGLVLWFDAMLGEGAHFSNAPGAPELVFGRAFFPWPEPVPVVLGDAIAATVQAKFVGD